MKPVKIKHPSVSVASAMKLVDGSQQRLAELLGIHRQTVHNWIVQGLVNMPVKQAYIWRKHYGIIERQGEE